MNLKEINKQIKFNNDKFEKASKAEKRVLIAKDIIQSINAGLTKCHTGLYLPTFNNNGGFKQLQDVIEDEANGPGCSVCALGSLFLHDIGRRNKFEFSVYQRAWENDSHRKLITDRLKNYFSLLQLDCIESCFEEAYFFSGKESNKEIVYKAIYLGYHYTEKHEDIWGSLNSLNPYRKHENYKMFQIMSNIVRNKGSFKVTDETIAKLPKLKNK